MAYIVYIDYQEDRTFPEDAEFYFSKEMAIKRAGELLLECIDDNNLKPKHEDSERAITEDFVYRCFEDVRTGMEVCVNLHPINFADRDSRELFKDIADVQRAFYENMRQDNISAARKAINELADKYRLSYDDALRITQNRLPLYEAVELMGGVKEETLSNENKEAKSGADRLEDIAGYQKKYRDLYKDNNINTEDFNTIVERLLVQPFMDKYGTSYGKTLAIISGKLSLGEIAKTLNDVENKKSKSKEKEDLER